MSAPSLALRQAIEGTLTQGGVPGASVAVTGPRGLLWAEGFGIADVTTGRPATADTVYHLFSGTKLFTATAIVQLAERGALSLDDEIGAHVPSAKGLAGVRFRHLLSHSAGLADTMRAFLAVRFPGEPRIDTAAALALYRLRASVAPGVRVRYANVGYALLGEVVHRVAGVPYTEHVLREIARPLGMASAFSVDDVDLASMATGTIERWDPMRLALRVRLPDVARRVTGARVGRVVVLRPYDLASAAIGGLLGHVVDFAKFLAMHLDGGQGVLSPASVSAMQAMVAQGAAGIASRVGVGLGWKHGRAGDHAFLNHEGGGAGFTTELRLYPSAGLGIAVAMNAMRKPKTMRIAHVLCERILAAGR